MKRFRSRSLMILALLCFALATERKSWGYFGYVDPGSGLLAVQAAMSVVAATGYYLRKRIMALFGIGKSETGKSDAATVETVVVPQGPARRESSRKVA